MLMSLRFTEPTVVEVFVASWEIECCAPPPAVGEPTTWTLGFQPGHGEYADPDLDRERDWLVEPRDGWTAVTDGPLVAWWNDHAGPVPAPGRHRLRGLLVGSAHGLGPQDVPATTGTVRRVRLVSQVYRPGRDGTLLPVRGTVSMADRERSPRWFRIDRIDSGTDVPQQTGVLLDVAVAGP
ncbi:hypothetical protein BJF78_15715 [Pseudonocardia sp. CNS-139]|nr:hypothetical protein BJF78_15715 [Pseudonocardia sp. CNS-139]